MMGGVSTMSLVTAALLGGQSIAKMLQALEAVPRLTKREVKRALNSVDCQMKTKPLLLAASLGRVDAVKDLLFFGADADCHIAVKHARQVAIESEIESVECNLRTSESELRRLEGCARQSGESGAEFEVRLQKGLARAEHVDGLWRRAESDFKRGGAASVAEMLLQYEPTLWSRGVVENSAHAMLVALGELSSSEPWEGATGWWKVAQRISRRLRLTEDLMALRQTPSRQLVASKEAAQHVVDVADECAKAALNDKCEYAPALGTIATWLRAVSATVEAALHCDESMKSVVEGYRRHDCLKCQLKKKQQECAEVVATLSKLPTCSIGAAAAALGAPGVSRGDVRGPIHAVRETEDRAECVLAVLKAGLNVERYDDQGWTVFGLASSQGYWRLAVELLEKYDAHPDGGNMENPPLVQTAKAASRGTPGAAELLFYLLKHGNASAQSTFGSTALGTMLLNSGDVATCLELISRGARPERGMSQCRDLSAERTCVGSASMLLNHECSSLFSNRHEAISQRRLLRIADFAFKARGDETTLKQLSIADAPVSTFRDGVRLRAVDETHELFNLEILRENGQEHSVVLEDGSALPMNRLSRDARIYWKLKLAHRPRIHTVVHVAAEFGDAVDCRLLLEAYENERKRRGLPRSNYLLDAPDDSGRTPLGIAIKSGNKSVALFFLQQLESRSPNIASWHQPDVSSLFARPARRRARRISRDLGKISIEDVAEDACGDSGMLILLTSHLVDLETTQPTRNVVASLWSWSENVPPLDCAERARRALQKLSMAPSEFPDEKAAKKPIDLSRIRVSSLAALKKLLAPREIQARSNIETCLALFHRQPISSDEKVEEMMLSPSDSVLPNDILSEVRTYWASARNEESSSYAQQLGSFLKVWRERPNDVEKVLLASHQCLSWLRCLVAARVQEIVAKSRKEGEDLLSDRALQAASAVINAQRRMTELKEELNFAEANVKLAQDLVHHVNASPSARRRLRCVELVRRQEWIELMCCSGRTRTAGLVAYRSNLLDAIASLLRLTNDKTTARAVGRVRKDENREDQTKAAIEILNFVHHFDARRAFRSRSADIAATKALVAIIEATPLVQEVSPGIRNVCDATLFWIRAALHALEEGEPQEENGNILLDAIRAFGDDEDVLPKLVDYLGAEACVRLANRCDNGENALQLAASRWAPCTLSALLRAGADPAVCGSEDSLLRLALKAAPCIGVSKVASKKESTALNALATVFAAKPEVFVENSAHSTDLVDLASSKGYMKLVDQLLAAGAIPRPPSSGDTLSSTKTALHAAAASGEYALVTHLISSLLRNGSASNARSAMCDAYQEHSVQVSEQSNKCTFSSPVVSRLLERAQSKEKKRKSPTYAHYPIHFAVRAGHAKIVSFLLDALNDPEAATGEKAARQEAGFFRRHYRDTIHGKLLLLEAAYARQPMVVAALLKFGGFDVCSRQPFAPFDTSVTPLDVSVRRNCVDSVSLLLGAGAEPELAIAQRGALRGYQNVTIALLSALQSRDDLLNDDEEDDISSAPLTFSSSKIDTRLSPSTKETMLHAAARNGNAELVHTLLALGASIRLKDAYGATAMHNSVAAGQSKVTRLLARHSHEYDASCRVITRAMRRSKYLLAFE